MDYGSCGHKRTPNSKRRSLGTSYLARKAAKQILQKTGTDPQEIDALIVATTTPDYKFPSTASIVLGKLGLTNAFAYDLEAACCGFMYALSQACTMVESGRCKKVIVIGADKNVFNRRLYRSSNMRSFLVMELLVCL